jgi:hypothetical protein
MKNLDLFADLLNDSATRRQMGYCSSTRHCALIYPHIPKHVGGSSLCGTKETHVHTDLFSRSVSPRFPTVGMCQGPSLFYDTVNTFGKFKTVSRLSWSDRKGPAKKKKSYFDVYTATEEGDIIVPFCNNTLPRVLFLTAYFSILYVIQCW